MIPNRSPWIHQLRRTRPVVSLTSDCKADVVIVGGGIAGVSTAYFALRDTTQSVALLEADKIAHGATGHNAGQLTSYFERPLKELVEEFGLEAACEAQRSVESAWALIDEIVGDAQLATPLYRFTGYAGIANEEGLITHLEENKLRRLGGLQPNPILVSDTWERISELPTEYEGLYSLAPHSAIRSLIEARSERYIACVSSPKGCMNSALFSEELVGYLLATYPERFSLHEGSPVKTVKLVEAGAELSVGEHTVHGSRVVLCTNGFENFHIDNTIGQDIDTSFHGNVFGRIGYMSAYLEPQKHPPAAISYYLPESITNVNDQAGEIYFYLTRRPYAHESSTAYNLVSTGGPEKVLPNDAIYSREDYCSFDVKIAIEEFLRDNYDKYPEGDAEHLFCWHGLMGYTPNRVRRIGPEPVNPTLLYNLGCNGVGILPSIYGGKRIARFLNNEAVEKSIFDPHDQSYT